MTCVRHHTTIDQAGDLLSANAERYLRPGHDMARLFKGYEAALAASLEITDACRFSLDDLSYDYPREPVPAGETPQSQLEALTRQGAALRRWVSYRSNLARSRTHGNRAAPGPG